jgi:hypothetical protein
MPETAFGWDSNQTSTFDDPQGEIGEDLPAREKALGCDPEASNTAQGGGTEKP